MKKPQIKEEVIPSSEKCLVPVGTRYGVDIYEDNPFLESFGIMIRKKSSIVASGLKITDTESEDVSVGIIGQITEVDTENFLKIYTQNVQAFFDLSATAQRLLPPLMWEIQQQSKDIAHVFFTHKQAVKACKRLNLQAPSQPTFARGIKELIQKDFLAVNAMGVGWFWINPSILFNGDRVRFVKEYRLKRKEERLEQGKLF